MFIMLSSLLVLLLAFSAHASSESCGVVGVLKADTKSCDKFYQCTNSGWSLLVCPTGLYFNPDNSVCDHPDQVHCEADTDDKDNDNDDQSVNTCDHIGQKKRDPKDCGKYYKCTHKGWISKSCMLLELFNPRSLTCDLSLFVTCDEDSHQEDDSGNSDHSGDENDDQSDTNSCGVVGVLKADAKSCDKFYQCTNSGWSLLVCPTGLYFNPDNSVCDHPDQVHCEADTDDKNNDNDDQSLNTCEHIGQKKKDPKNCGKYYKCTHKGWISKSCMLLELFNPRSLTCDLSLFVTCDEDSHQDDHSGNSDHSDDDQTDTESCGVVGVLKADTKSCDKFYQCTNSGWSLLVCPTGLYFNPDNSVCDHPDQVHCEADIDDKDNDNDDQSLDTCDHIGQKKRDPKDCGKYYKCTHKGWISKSCMLLELFNPRSLTCDLSLFVTCEEDSHQDDNSGNADHSDDENGDQTDTDPCEVVGVLKADTKSCDKFYQCTNSGWTLLVCPTGLYFNPDNSLCDYPDQVHCEADTDDKDNDDDDQSLDTCDHIGQKKKDPKNCAKYYKCTDKGWISKSCMLLELFNPRSLTCDLSLFVTCEEDSHQDDHSGHSDHSDEEHDDQTDMESCKLIGQKKGDSKSCRRYYQCTEAGWSYRECRSPLLFNSRSLTCDYAMYVTCEKDMHVRSSDVSDE